MATLTRPTRLISWVRNATALAVALLTVAVTGCSPSAGLPTGPLPQNVGYLRSSDNVDSSKLSQLTIFDADTFEVYSTVALPKSHGYVANRMVKDAYGRIWISYNQEGMNFFPKSDSVAVLVFSPEGNLLHKLTPKCGPVMNIAFANHQAFLLCLWSGFSAKVAVVDINTMETVKVLDEIAPPLASGQGGFGDFFAYTLTLVNGVMLVFGGSYPPETYQSLTHTSDGVATTAAIDPITLEVVGYHTSLQPGSRVQDALDVGGQAWMLNKWSHLEERPPRTDIYVLDPHTLEIVNRFNLPRPYPQWGRVAADGTIYIFHIHGGSAEFNAGLRSGFSRVDPETLEATFTEAGGVSELAFDWDQAIDVYRGRPCVTQIRSGLWCQNADGTMTLEIEQLGAHGILFVPGGD